MRKFFFSLICVIILSTAKADVCPGCRFNVPTFKDTVSADSSGLAAGADSLKTKIKRDTLKPIDIKPFYNFSRFLNRNVINRSNYKYTGDLLKNFGFDYMRDYGLDGHPNENMLYGVGYNGISYFEDGILLNNRLINNFDLNNVQSEYIDSIEVLPVTRGFLYGVYNNNTAVVFHDRDFISKLPYSRIKYYQGPNGEAMIDVIFNQLAYKRFKFSVDVTNRKFDSSYVNSAYSQWMVRSNVKYYLSDFWNISAAYGFVKSKVGLNGGVNIDSLTNPNLGVNGNLYNEQLANVFSLYKNQSYKEHLFSLRLLGMYSKISYTDLTIYYYFNETNLNDKKDSTFYKSIDKEKLVGLNLDQRVNFDFLNLNVRANYESGRLKYYSLYDNYFNYYPVSYNRFSIAPVISANLLDSSLVPSLFLKFSGNKYEKYTSLNGVYSGFGGDLTYHYSHEIKFYAGFSNYKPGPGQQYVYNYEIGAGLESNILAVNLTLFKRNNYSDYELYPFLNTSRYTVSDLLGTSADFKILIWKLALESHLYYYSSPKVTGLFYEFPQLNLNGGLYYEGLLFHDNLNLKSGISLDFTGKRKEFGYGILGENLRLDFTLAGEIQKVAYVYFTWENLLNTQYYIIPYYPMPSRNIRFGIAWELFN